jgi:AmiR/NasT family two-component response regulator
MTQKQITQAAIGYRKQVTIWRGRKEAHYANRDFIAGANHRQPEIDALTTEIENYKRDLEESKQRERIAQGIIREKRKEVERLKRAAIYERQ